MKLSTKDILGKELLSTGTFHGRGSPPEGDTYTEADLDGIVAAAGELSLKRPFKLGHNEEQNLIAADGLPGIGWIENLRRVGTKLLGDIRKIPEKVFDLIEAGGYRTLSPELRFNFPDPEDSSRIHPRVFTGLALLGADIPACTSLDDFLALYGQKVQLGDLRSYAMEAEAGGELHVYADPEEHLHVIKHEGDDWVLYDKDGEKVLGTFGSEQEAEDREGEIIAAVAAKGMTAEEDAIIPLVPETQPTEYTEGEDPDLVAKFSALMEEMEGLIKGKTGAPRLRVWVSEAQKGLTVIARQAVKKVADSKGAGNSMKDMSAADEPIQNGEAKMKTEVCLALGLPEDTPDEDVLAKVKELHEQPTPDLKNYVAKDAAEYIETRAMAEEGRKAKTELFEIKRDQVLDKALAEGRILPADIETWQTDYAADAAMTVRHLEHLKPTVILAGSGSALGGGEPRDLSDRTVLDEETRKYQAGHPEMTYKDALMAVQSR